MLPAAEVTAGHLLVTSSGLEKVAMVRPVTGRGWGTPCTGTGDLLVNGVLASNYAHAPSHRLAHLWMSPFRWPGMGLLGEEDTQAEVGYSCWIKKWATKIPKICAGDIDNSVSNTNS